MRFSAAIALIVVISTELLVGASGGLGQFIYLQGSNAGRMDLVLAGTVLAGVFGYLVNPCSAPSSGGSSAGRAPGARYEHAGYQSPARIRPHQL
ncbi:MAG: hypothetical protein ACRDQ5_22125, partial [Sciscionella sp.]